MKVVPARLYRFRNGVLGSCHTSGGSRAIRCLADLTLVRIADPIKRTLLKISSRQRSEN